MTITPPLIMLAVIVMIVSPTPTLPRERERGSSESLARRSQYKE